MRLILGYQDMLSLDDRYVYRLCDRLKNNSDGLYLGVPNMNFILKGISNWLTGAFLVRF